MRVTFKLSALVAMLSLFSASAAFAAGVVRSKGFVKDIGSIAVKNEEFRQVLYTAIKAGFAVIVPAGTNHNIKNTGIVPMKLYAIYSPPKHRDGVVHHTHADAAKDNEHFDGKTTE